MNWTAYQNYWDAHWRHVGPDTFVTDMAPDVYNAYLEKIFSGYQQDRRVSMVFDLGCGTGGLVPTIMKLWPQAYYIGLDICAEAISFAKSKYPAFKWIVLNKPGLPGMADLIVCHSVFTHISVDDTEKYLDVIREALHPKGRASLSIHGNTPQPAVGGIGRMDINPVYFEQLLFEHGFKILSTSEYRQRYYEVEAC